MSDAHANPRALETALADAEKFDCGKYVLLGDVTGYGYDVKTTLKMVREKFDIVLMGNHDSACVGLEPAWEVMAVSNYDKGKFRTKFEKRFMTPATEPESVSFKLKDGSRYIVNVGSVGYPRNDLCCSYGIYDTEKKAVTIRRLPFDFKSYIMEMLARKINLPMWLCEILMAASGKSH